MPKAPSRPRAEPMSASFAPEVSTRRVMSPAWAPSVRRIPNSPVRWAVARARTPWTPREARPSPSTANEDSTLLKTPNWSLARAIVVSARWGGRRLWAGRRGLVTQFAASASSTTSARGRSVHSCDTIRAGVAAEPKPPNAVRSSPCLERSSLQTSLQPRTPRQRRSRPPPRPRPLVEQPRCQR